MKRPAPPVSRRLLVCALACAIPQFAHSQSADWAAATTGNWSQADRWSPAAVPNGPASVVTIGAAGPAYVVNLNQDAQVSSLTLSSANATFQHSSGRTLTVGDTLAINAGTYNLAGTIAGGTIVQGGGTLNFSGNATLDGATLTGDLNLGNSAQVTLRNGATFEGSATLGNNAWLHLDSDYTFDAKTVTMEQFAQIRADAGASAVVIDQDSVITGHTAFYANSTGAGATLLNQGTINKTGNFFATISGDTDFTFTNEGSVTVSQGGLTLGSSNNHVVNKGSMTATGGSLSIASVTNSTFVNEASGVVHAQGGTINLGANNVLNHAGTTLTGGTWAASNGGTLSFETTTDTITTNAATLVLDGAGSTIRTRTGPGNAYQSLEQTLTHNQGSLAVLGNRDFSASNGLTNSGTLELGGGTLAAPSLTNSSTGVLTGHGTVDVRPVNSGTIAASGSTLAFSNGIQGGSGTVTVNSGATLDLSAGTSSSSADFLQQNGTLVLGSNDFVVSKDYTNANFGSGNTFNARAGVTGTGQILADGDVGQAITGDRVFDGTTANATLNLGNFREGELVSASFNIVNTGTTGPDLRGALQTSVNGANITDLRLTGSGVTAGNFDPIAAGDSRSFTVHFDGTTPGAIEGQVVHIANNFDNVADQNLQIIGGGIFRTAQGSATPDPMNLGSTRVGGSLSGQLAVSNVAGDTGGYTETLGATISGTTGHATASGSVSGLAHDAGPSTAISIGLDTTTAGAKSGTVGLAYTSTEIGGSGLGTIAVGGQTVEVSGAVYLAAAANALPTTVDLGTMRVGSTVNSALAIQNIAADTGGFTETLAASFGAVDSGLTGLGSLSGLGNSDGVSHAMSVAFNAATTGTYNGSATVDFVSEAVAGSGLDDLQLGYLKVDYMATVNALAEVGLLNPGGFGDLTMTGAYSAVYDFGTLSTAATTTGSYDLFNLATGPADSLLGWLDLSDLSGTPFGVIGAGSFNLGAGEYTSYQLSFNPMTDGFFDATLNFELASHNPYQDDLGLPNFALTLRGRLLGGPVNAIPDTGSTLLLGLLGFCALALASRHSARGAARS